MSESELWGLSYSAIEALQTEETTFLTILFGYLIAAYFVTAKLKTSQLIIFNLMYLTTACGLIWNMWGHWTSIFLWVNEAQLAGGQPVTSGLATTITATAIYSTLLLASLYFMWSIRKGRAQFVGSS